MTQKKKEKIFINVVCNLIVIVLVFVMGVIYFVSENNQLSVMASNSEYNGTIYAGDKTSKNVSLMVNVYWGTEYLEKMLEIFEKENVKTTFFVGGTWVKDNGELLKKMHASGHEIASHGTKHKEHGKLSYQDNLTEIQTCHEIVKHNLNFEMELFAPPGGSYNANTIKAAEFLGYKTIMWTRDTIDWRDKSADLIYNRAVTNLSGGDLVLMHPTMSTSQALPRIIDRIKELGFNLTTVSETLGLKT